jgi:hypothetical protein
MLKRMKRGIRLWLLVWVAVTALMAMAGEALLILRQAFKTELAKFDGFVALLVTIQENTHES